MKFPRIFPRVWSLKYTPVTLIVLFLLANVIGALFNSAFAPVTEAVAVTHVEEYIPADMPTSGDRELDLIILRTGERHGVDPRLVHHVIWQESRYRQQARSHAGAQGLMQLMPATARRFNCQDVNDPTQNIEAGTRYLRWLLRRFEGNVTLALAGYNAGEGSVDRFDGVPPYDETRNYVRIITGRYGSNHHPVLTPEQARLEFRLIPQVAHLQ